MLVKSYIQSQALRATAALREALEYIADKVDNGQSTKVGLEQVDEVNISAAAIVATTVGNLGHANGVELVAAPGAGYFLELLSATLVYNYNTAAYTGGGNVTVNIGAGGAALTGLVSAANSLGAAASKIVNFQPLAAAGNSLVENKGINLVAATAFTQPGTAAGTVSVRIRYRIHTV